MGGSKTFILIAIVFLMVGLFVTIAGFRSPPPLVDGESLTYPQITKDQSYYIQDLCVVWKYGSMTGTTYSGSYYLAYFTDKNGDLCTVSLYFDNSKDWKATSLANNYEEADMLMSGCFRAKAVASVDATMKQYYEECLADFSSINAPYLGSLSIRDTGLHFHYVCDEREEYASASKAPVPQFIFGGLMILLSGLFFYLFKKGQEFERNASRIQMTDAQFDPFTGAPIAPQQDAHSQQSYSASADQDSYQGPEF